MKRPRFLGFDDVDGTRRGRNPAEKLCFLFVGVPDGDFDLSVGSCG
jgi:hypothetical protein